MSEIKLTARDSGPYIVYVDDVEYSRHTTEREAVENVTEALAESPTARVFYRHDYTVDAALVDAPEEPPEEPLPPEEEPEDPPVEPPLEDPPVGPGPNPTLHPNEPAGYVQIADTAWNEVVPAGWTGYVTGHLSIVDDPAAPMSPSKVAACLFPKGFVGGGGPINILRPIGKPEFYTHFALKVSDNWYGHPVGVKLFFIRNTIAGQEKGDIVFFIAGAGSNPLSFEIRTQNVVDGGKNYAGKDLKDPNGPNPAILTRGRWHGIEVRLVSDSAPGKSDGQIHVWVDDVKTHELTNVSLLRLGADRVQDVFQWNPTYGGGNQASVPADQYQYIDHIYVSGR
jgi:hypothetical protein